jgi:predicted alpha/beta-fold hydrolase
MEKLYKAGFNVVCVNQRGVAYSKLTVWLFNIH